MKVIKPETSEVVYRTLLSPFGDQLFSVGVLTLFSLHPETSVDLSQAGAIWAVAKQALGTDTILDEGWPKSRSEFLVYGNAYALEGLTTQPLSVVVRVGDITKALAVFGDRKFNALGLISSPAAFSKMPIVPSTAYGGPSCPSNPAGKGANELPSSSKDNDSVWPLPNIEYPSKLMVQRSDAPPPAGFWAFASDSAQRKSWLGRFDKKWQDQRWPHLPTDTAPEYFQVAPQDQQFGVYLKGGEPVDLQNMHPRLSHIESTLPAQRTRVFIEKKTSAEIRHELVTSKDESQREFEELPTHLETVWLFPELLCGAVLHRATTKVQLADAEDIAYVNVAIESLDHETCTLEEHKNQFMILSGRALEADSVDTSAEIVSEVDAKTNEAIESLNIDMPIDTEIVVEPEAVTGFIAKIEAEILAESPELEEARKNLPRLMEKYGVKQEDVDKMLEKDKDEAKTFSELREQAKEISPNLFAFFNKIGVTESDLIKQMKERADLREYGDLIEQTPGGLKGVFEQLDKQYAELIKEEKQIDERMATEATSKKGEADDDLAEAESPDEMDARLLVTDLRQLVITRHGRKRDLKGLDLSGVDLSDLTLEGADFSGANLAEANFEKSRLQNCRFDEALLSQARFGGADLSGASLQEVSATQADFTNCRMVKANLTRSDFSESKFQKAQISGSTIAFVDFSRAVMQDVDASGCHGEFAGFTECQLTASNFSDTNLRGVNFTGANLQQVNLSKASLKRGVLYSANFTDAVFNQATLPDSVADEKTIFVRTKMIEADFTGAVWNRSRFEDVDMSRAQMSGADLTGAQLNNVRIIRAVAKNMILAKASIVDCDLTGANFFEGSFSNAQLARCKLQLANFFGVDFSDTVLEVCDLEGSIIDRTILQVRGKSN